jgi:serine protease Do
MANRNIKSWLTRHMIIPILAVGIAASVGIYQLSAPSPARAAAWPAPAAAPLDDNSVNALLSLDQAMETLAARVTPAVVNVTVTSKAKTEATQLPEGFGQFFGPGGPFGEEGPGGPNGRQFGRPGRSGPQFEHGLGSGVIISPDGYIVTNNHVVDGATDIRVTMSNRHIYSAKLVGTDSLTDLAVIKIEGSNFPSVPLGDSAKLQPGQTVLAFGNPLGMQFSVTRGIVSALNRPNPYAEDRRKPGQFIQTDAAINQGNSGGPLVDSRGEVVGINTFLISPSGAFAGMGFAIPSNIVQPTIETLIRDGKITHGYMGIGISDVTPENARFFNVKKSEGAVVTQVEPGSPAAHTGLKVGDVITGLNGKPVSDAGALQVEVGQKAPGTTIHLDLLREGNTMSLPVTLEAMGARDKGNEESATSENNKPRWGVGITDLTPDVREQLDAPSNVHGAVIENVQPGSAADNAGLQQGDVIVEVNRKPVASAADVRQALSGVPKGEDALVLIWSHGGSTFRVLHPTAG